MRSDFFLLFLIFISSCVAKSKTKFDLRLFMANHLQKWANHDVDGIESDFASNFTVVINGETYSSPEKADSWLRGFIGNISENCFNVTSSAETAVENIFNHVFDFKCAEGDVVGVNTFVIESEKIKAFISVFEFKPLPQGITNVTWEVLMRHGDAWDNRDIDALLSTFSEDVVVIFNGNVSVGIEPVGALIKEKLDFIHNNCDEFNSLPPVVVGKYAHSSWYWNCNGGKLAGATTFIVEGPVIRGYIQDNVFLEGDSESENEEKTENFIQTMLIKQKDNVKNVFF